MHSMLLNGETTSRVVEQWSRPRQDGGIIRSWGKGREW